jgi:hypothetical protein
MSDNLNKEETEVMNGNETPVTATELQESEAADATVASDPSVVAKETHVAKLLLYIPVPETVL